MTMQVGMVGSDGIVLASDTKWVTVAVRGPRKYRDPRHDSKIKVNDDIAVCCAREMDYATLMGDAILSCWSTGGDGDYSKIKKAFDSVKEKVEQHEWECLIAIAAEKRLVRVFNAFVTDGDGCPPEWRLFVFPEMRFCQTGDDANDARYWLSYYDSSLSVGELKGLAAHLVVEARNFNNAMIGGLEIVYSDASGFHRLSKEENDKWHAKAEGWSKSIGELIMGAR